MAAPRRILALDLPDLLCELGRAQFPEKASRTALAVVLVDEIAQPPGSDGAGEGEATAPADETDSSALIDAVDTRAQGYGVRAGQSIAEACALVAQLTICKVPHQAVRQALGRVAEVALAFGTQAAIEAPASAGERESAPGNTVWLDISGSAHLVGGEQALAAELLSRVRALGHMARVAISDGPRLAQAFARFRALGSEHGVLVVPKERAQRAFAELPVTALPIPREQAAWLSRLGVLSVGELVALPKRSLSSRLGDRAAQVLALCSGHDPEPLVPYQLPRVLVEQSSWEEPLDGREPLLFVLRGLCSRMSARLAGRGEAAQKLRLRLECDRSIARLRGAAPALELEFELAGPLWRETELFRVVSSRLEALELRAPTLGLCLEVPLLTPAHARQLDLSRLISGISAAPAEDSLPVLLAELAADIGKEHVGVLKIVDSHRLEKRSKLVSARRAPRKASPRAKRGKNQLPIRVITADDARLVHAPTRVLPAPLRLDAPLRVGATLAIDQRLYTIEQLAFEQRLESVEWWTQRPVSRDYVRLWLDNPDGGVAALVYVDRETGARYLQAVLD